MRFPSRRHAASRARAPRAVLHPLLLAAVVAVSAGAQDNVQSAPVQTAPPIETFTLPQATPTPTPSPSPAPSASPVAPPPVVRTRPDSVAPPAPRATATPSPRPAAERAPVLPPTPAPTPATVPLPPAPAPAPAPRTSPEVAAVRAAGGPPWLAIGGGLLALLVAGVVLTLRRRPAEDVGQNDVAPVVVPPVAAPVPAAPVTTASPATPPALPVSGDAPVRGLATTLRPKEMWTRGPDAFLAFDLVVTNRGAEDADAIRAAMALATAGPGIADEIAGWQAAADFAGAPEPFALRRGESYVLGGELKLPGDLMHVNEVADRAMIVPVAMIALRWRGGLAVRTAGDAYVIGTGDAAAAKLGPIWVDRAGQRFAPLDARRFQPGR